MKTNTVFGIISFAVILMIFYLFWLFNPFKKQSIPSSVRPIKLMKPTSPSQSSNSPIPSVTPQESPKDLVVCEQDDDCVMVTYYSCCSTNLAINKKYKKLYENHPEWQRMRNEDLCAKVSCFFIPEKSVFCSPEKRCDIGY